MTVPRHARPCNPHARPCKYLWLMPMVSYSGDVTVCCNDVFFEFQLGNSYDSSLQELWEGEKVTQMRLRQIEGAWDQIRTPSGQAKCLQCIQHWHPPVMNDAWILDYLVTVGRDELIPRYLERVYPDEKKRVKFLQSIGRRDTDTHLSPTHTHPPLTDASHGTSSCVTTSEDVETGKEVESIRICPTKPHDKRWSQDSYLYNNEDRFDRGFSFIAGQGTGFYEYRFPATFLHPRQVTVTTRLASLEWQTNQSSEVTLSINGVSLGTREVTPLQSGHGEVYTWHLENIKELQLVEMNQLRLEIRSDASCKGGLAVLDQPLQEGLEHEPITIVLDNRNAPQTLTDSDRFPIHVDTVLIELADHCNLRCIMCDQSPEGGKRHGHEDVSEQVHSTEKGFMATEDVIKVIDDINRGSLRYGVLSLFWLGEPLLHPDFPRLIEYISTHRRNFSGWLIHTNGLLLTEQATSQLLQHSCGQDVLHFSVDAATGETYAKVRRGGDFSQLMHNIEVLLSRKQSHTMGQVQGRDDSLQDRDSLLQNEGGPQLVFQFIVLPENQHEAGAFVERFSSLLAKYGQQATVACQYSQFGQNTVFLREEMTTQQKQPEARALHRKTCQSLGLECD